MKKLKIWTIVKVIIVIVIGGIIIDHLWGKGPDVKTSAKASAPSVVSNSTAEAPPLGEPGWPYDHKTLNPKDGSFVTWYRPESYDKPTKPFEIAGYCCSFKVKADVIIEFVSKKNGSEITSLKYDWLNDKKYLQDKDQSGSFSTVAISDSEDQKIGLSSKSFRFRPLNGHEMTGLKVSKVE